MPIYKIELQKCILNYQNPFMVYRKQVLELGLRMRIMPHAAPCQCALCMRIGHVKPRCQKLVRVWERLCMVELNIKSEHNLYLACEDSPQHAFFFCTFSCSLLALSASTVHWLHNFLNAANRRLCSVLNSAKHVRCGAPAVLPYPSSIVKKRSCSLSFIARLGIVAHPVSSWVSARDAWVHLHAR